VARALLLKRYLGLLMISRVRYWGILLCVIAACTNSMAPPKAGRHIVRAKPTKVAKPPAEPSVKPSTPTANPNSTWECRWDGKELHYICKNW